MKIQKWLLIAIGCLALCTAPLLEVGCKHPLAPGGAYSQLDTNGVSGQAVYSADLSITTAKDIIGGFLRWEKTNRPLVQAKFPEVTTYAIKLSNDAPKWLQSATSLRDAYAANPTAANKTAFDSAMAVLDEAVAQAQKYFAQGLKAR